jgi:ABC-type multidrug transport system fused ATPase/permease subunit
MTNPELALAAPPVVERGGDESGAAARIQVSREIRLENVSFRYPAAEGPAIRHVDLVVPANRTVALVGSTGAGKTTIADLLLGLFLPTEGTILVDDLPLDSNNIHRWKASVGYVPQAIYLCDQSITKNIALGIPDELIDHTAVERAARAAHLTPFVARLTHGFDTIVGERGVRLSGGQRQRIGIARALYHNPPVLVLDEATSALDNVTEDFVLQAIRELARQRTIVLIAHRLSTVEACDRIFLIEDGTVAAQGTFDELVSESASFRAMARV